MNPISPDNSPRDWQPSAGDELASRLLDDEAPSAALAAPAPADRQRAADLQWLDAMLEQSYGHNRAAASRAISATLSRLSDEPSTSADRSSQVDPRPAARRSNRWLAVAVAASVLVGLFFVASPKATRSAYAMVERAYQVALEPRDREYRITLSGGGPGRMLPRQVSFQVRGGEQFVLTIAGPRGGVNRIGRDGPRFWYVPPVGRVFVADGDTFVGAWLERSSADMPYLKLSTLLARLRDTYELSVLPNEMLGDKMTNHLIALRRDAVGAQHPNWPLSIELWTDPASGMIRKAEITRPAAAAGFAGEHITFELISEQPVADSVYQLQTYAGNRPIAMPAAGSPDATQPSGDQ